MWRMSSQRLGVVAPTNIRYTPEIAPMPREITPAFADDRHAIETLAHIDNERNDQDDAEDDVGQDVPDVK